eukprot:GDKI01040470.1.p1 GENE.GDKI01040470.1~~GDKI01040470.1.p1  ORF type:complete len:121 (+),score=4.76 GDKI01040470.1:69-431(+)
MSATKLTTPSPCRSIDIFRRTPSGRTVTLTHPIPIVPNPPAIVQQEKIRRTCCVAVKEHERGNKPDIWLVFEQQQALNQLNVLPIRNRTISFCSTAAPSVYEGESSPPTPRTTHTPVKGL